ncbi:antibiotic biosynthesis monooxygenase [Oxalobacteraceae bacterium]|nr:antibiotic biosynthesis monooxygenase [Oxalobacteraceae bacterium]
MPIANTGATPYYAVIFTSIKSEDGEGYGKMAEAMVAAAARQPGFLGMETAHGEVGITISYWDSLASIAAWKADKSHQVAQKTGRERWYSAYKTRICKVERDYDFGAL